MDSNKKQTAVDWLETRIREYGKTHLFSLRELVKQAKELEKKQITEGYFKGFTRELGNRDEDAEGYYNEIYGGNNG